MKTETIFIFYYYYFPCQWNTEKFHKSWRN